MKKSRIFMWAYVTFLLISSVINIFMSPNEVFHNIALSATLAGYFFAVADLIEYYIGAENKKKAITEKTIEIIRQSVKGLKLNENLTSDPTKSGENCSQNKNVTISQCLQELEQKIGDLEKEVMQAEKQIKKKECASAGFQITGFIVFLLSCTYRFLLPLPEKTIDAYTVMAFAVIMATYAIKEDVEDKLKKQEETINSLIGDN